MRTVALWRKTVAAWITLAIGSHLAAGDVGPFWEDLPPLPTPRQEVGVAGVGSEIYVIGGILANRIPTGIVERFDVDERSWAPVAPLPNGTRLHHLGAAAVGSTVYAIGGLDAAFRGVRSVFAYERLTGLWRRAADLPTARGGMGVAVVDGRIYAAGGQDGGTSFDHFAVYTPEDDRWEVLPALPTARNHLAAVGYQGRLYAVGGRTGRLFGTLEVYDPALRAWSRLAPMPTPRAGIAAAVLGEALHVFGGEGNRSSPTGVFEETETYHFAGDTWYTSEPMPHPRHGIGAAVTWDERAVYIPGGAAIEGFDVVATHDAFHPGSPPWSLPSFFFVRGDADDNGTVNIADATFTLSYLFGGGRDLPCPDAADTNDDGVVNVADPIAALIYLFASGPAPPPPGPEPGRDPTDFDSLGCRS